MVAAVGVTRVRVPGVPVPAHRGRPSAGGEGRGGQWGRVAPGAGGGGLLGFVLVLPGAYGRWCWSPGLALGLWGLAGACCPCCG